MRNAAKALLVKEGAILLIKHKTDRVYYTLPGGGQKPMETMEECLLRECLEETGYRVELGDLAFVYEFLGKLKGQAFHQMDLVFHCHLKDHVGPAEEQDDSQIGHEWVNLRDLDQVDLVPNTFKEKIMSDQGLCDYRVYKED